MEQAHSIPVLIYHHVTDRGGYLDVSAQHFESQIRSLASSGYKSLSAAQFAAFLNGQPVPRKSVVLTFDNGYLDNWVYAHPVLKRYGMKALLFAVTGLIGTGVPRAHAGQGRATPHCPTHQQARDMMFSKRRDEVMLRWSEIFAMMQAGTFEIHSHTHTHTRWDLGCKSNDEKIDRINEDLEASRRCLRENLGSESSHLCWPQGYFDDDYKRAARQHGFRYLYTADARGQNVPGGDISHIYRFVAGDRAAVWLRSRIWLASHPVWGPACSNWNNSRSL